MKFSERVYYRKLYFSFPLKEVPALREVYNVLLKGQRNILVDCGVSYNYPDLEQEAAEAGLKLSDIDVVINTHCHSDHTGGNKRLKDEFPKLPFWCHEAGKSMVEDVDSQFKFRPVPAFYHLNGGAVHVDRVLEGGEVLDIGYPVKVLSTPGHSADSISLYLPEEELLISGDAIPHIHDIPIYENLDELEASLQMMGALKPKYVISAFSGLWDMKEKGDIFQITQEHLKKIQGAVDSFIKENPQGTPEEMGGYVLKKIGVNSAVIPLFLRSLEEHVKRASV